MWFATTGLTLVWLVGALASGTDPGWPTDIKARLVQREDFGVKVKLAYTINSPESSTVEACIDACDESDGRIATGAFCGGYPNGCAVFKMGEPGAWVWSQETIDVRMRVDGGSWSEPVRYRIDKSARGEVGAVDLERIAIDMHGEL